MISQLGRGGEGKGRGGEGKGEGKGRGGEGKGRGGEGKGRGGEGEGRGGEGKGMERKGEERIGKKRGKERREEGRREERRGEKRRGEEGQVIYCYMTYTCPEAYTSIELLVPFHPRAVDGGIEAVRVPSSHVVHLQLLSVNSSKALPVNLEVRVTSLPHHYTVLHTLG